MNFSNGLDLAWAFIAGCLGGYFLGYIIGYKRGIKLLKDQIITHFEKLQSKMVDMSLFDKNLGVEDERYK